MSDTDDIEVTLEDTSAVVNNGEVELAGVEKTEKPSSEIDAGVDELKKNLNDTTAKLRMAETEAAELRTKVSQNRVEIGDNQLRLVSSAITQAEHDSTILRAEYATAMESGDYLKTAEIQDKLSRNAARIVQLETGKQQLERHLESTKTEVTREVNDPVEKIASQLSSKSAEFIRRHPEYVTDPRKNARLMGAHNYALSEGLVADSPEYFEYLEKNMGGAVTAPIKKTEDEAVSDASNEVKRPSGPTVAPVSRSGNSSEQKKTRITLTKEEREIAEISGLTYEQYARNKIAAEKNGELGRRQ